MHIHSDFGLSEGFSLHFCSPTSISLQNCCFETILVLETMPHGGTFVYYLFSAGYVHILSFMNPPPFRPVVSRTSVTNL